MVTEGRSHQSRPKTSVVPVGFQAELKPENEIPVLGVGHQLLTTIARTDKNPVLNNESGTHAVDDEPATESLTIEERHKP